MCGIVGYVGQRQAAEVILDGLTRLEYRGYDSAGIAVVDEGARRDIRRVRRTGRVSEMEAAAGEEGLQASLGANIALDG